MQPALPYKIIRFNRRTSKLDDSVDSLFSQIIGELANTTERRPDISIMEFLTEELCLELWDISGPKAKAGMKKVKDLFDLRTDTDGKEYYWAEVIREYDTFERALADFNIMPEVLTALL